ncbi:MAG: hypothetical protein ACI379_05615 [Nocardioides sp.]|uniref:hypothetical protein n=1 Tax=Nocardioides sp. TaxID=35761 RepID=UPI003F05BA02
MSHQGIPPQGPPQQPGPYPPPPDQQWQTPPPGPYGPPPPQFASTPPQGGPGWQGQPPAPLPPPGFIDLTIQGSVLTSNMLTPNVVIDGRHVPAQYGRNVIPVVPGRHHIHLYGEWMRRYGQADLQVDVQQGAYVPVFYRAPLHQFTTGNIGHEPQPVKGWWVLVLLLVILLAIIVVPVVAALTV